MYETTRRIRSISNSLNEAWKTLDFSNVQKVESKYNSIYMDLSRQLRAGLLIVFGSRLVQKNLFGLGL